MEKCSRCMQPCVLRMPHMTGSGNQPAGLWERTGDKLEQLVDRGQGDLRQLMDQVMTRALKMGENNACMGRIVAAPTAGSCGVLPAVLLTWQDLYEEKQERMVEALYVGSRDRGGHCFPGVYFRCGGRLSGRDRFRFCHGGRGTDLFAGRWIPEPTTHAAARLLKNLLGLGL